MGMVAIGTRLRQLVGAATHITAGSRVNHAVTPVSRWATIRESSSSIALTSGSSGRTMADLHKASCTRLVSESPDSVPQATTRWVVRPALIGRRFLIVQTFEIFEAA